MKKMSTSPKKKLVPGSKVPISYLIDYVKEGYNLSDFVSAYPWVKKSNAINNALAEVRKIIQHDVPESKKPIEIRY